MAVSSQCWKSIYFQEFVLSSELSNLLKSVFYFLAPAPLPLGESVPMSLWHQTWVICILSVLSGSARLGLTDFIYLLKAPTLSLTGFSHTLFMGSHSAFMISFFPCKHGIGLLTSSLAPICWNH